ncbi:MAG: site-specific DNA-methyltransferase [Nitrososphaerota archaeon]|nr:site-specific DNA-methyltransferase [Nitrososphaerota archaeon]
MWPIGLPKRLPARKLSVAQNVLKYGTGAINIDGCRIGTEDLEYRTTSYREAASGEFSGQGQTNHTTGHKQVTGRFPANLIHDGSDEVLAGFPNSKSSPVGFKGVAWKHSGNTGNERTPLEYQQEFNDSGSAARFFYNTREGEPSANSRYSDRGSTNFAALPGQRRPAEDSPSRFFYCAKASKSERGLSNDHPTIKPQKLMQYLIKLVASPEALVLDPFMGSGSTLLACAFLGIRSVGIEMDESSCEIAANRCVAQVVEMIKDGTY